MEITEIGQVATSLAELRKLTEVDHGSSRLGHKAY